MGRTLPLCEQGYQRIDITIRPEKTSLCMVVITVETNEGDGDSVEMINRHD
jgi:hypothetical protein